MTTLVDFSIVIVNYNSLDLLLDCIGSFIAAHHDTIHSYELLIADNCSSQKISSQNFINFKIPLTFFQLEQNLGFAAANNYAARFARGKYLIFLNPDTLCPHNLLDAFWNFFQQKQLLSSGIVAPLLLLPDNSPQPYAFGDFPTFFHLFTSHFSHRKTTLPTEDYFKTDWVSGACFACKNSLFQLLGGFSLDYFMYFEDVDLCYRAQSLGYSNFVLQLTTIIHLGGARTKLSRRRRQDYLSAQKTYFHKKYIVQPKSSILIDLSRYIKYSLFIFFQKIYQFFCFFKDSR